MADYSTVSLLAHLSRDERPDHELLTAFAQDRDQPAFEALVRRYAKLVFGVCRRTLGNPQDAEDAFQATFVVLARKAPTLTLTAPLAVWLHGVAFRIARVVRLKDHRRERRERKALPMTPTEPRTAVEPDDRWVALEAELAGLPDRYRSPLVLCYLQGLTHREAADALRIPAGSMARRLDRGLSVLRTRLARRGLVLPAAAVVGALIGAGNGTAAPPTLVTATVRAGMGGELSAAVLSLVQVGLAGAVGQVRVWAALLVCGGLAGAGFGVCSGPPDDPRPGVELPALAPRDAGVPVAGRDPAAGPRLVKFEMPVWRPDPDAKRRVALGQVKAHGTALLYAADRYVWEVELDRPGACLLLRVLPDGTEHLCYPTDPAAEPEVRTALRFPPIDMHNGGLGFDVAGNQLFVVVVQETAEAYADWSQRKQPVPWDRVNGEGFWAFDSAWGVREMAVFNGRFRIPNPDTRRPVEAAGRHYQTAPNVRGVRIYGLSIRSN